MHRDRTSSGSVCIHCGETTQIGESFCCSGCAIAYEAIHTIFADDEERKQFYKLAANDLQSPSQKSVGSIAPLEASVSLSGDIASAEWYLEGVHCRACVWLVDQMPRTVDGVTSAHTDISSNLLRLQWDTSRTSVEEIVNWLEPLGYSPHPTKTMETNAGLVSVGAAALFAMNAMMVTVTSYGGLSPENDVEVWRFLSITAGLLATGSLYIFRFRIFRLLRSIKLKNLPVDLPIVIGLIAAYFSSWYHLYTQTGELWFDAIAVLVALLLATEWYTDRTRRMIGQFTQIQSDLIPRVAIDISGKSLERDEIQPGDKIVAELNTVIITDGIALHEMVVDRSAQTGEAIPVSILEGDAVFAGDRVKSTKGAIYEATTRFKNSRIAQLLDTIRSPKYLDSEVVDRAEKLSSVFVKIVLFLAAISIVLSAIFLKEYSAVIALLIVACPCGLAIATPLSYAIGMGQIRRRGVLLKGASAIDKLDSATDIIFDKTGTLTDGNFRIHRFDGEAEDLRIASALESFSTHPIATAFQRSDRLLEIEEVVSDRLGVRGYYQGVLYRVGASEKKRTSEAFPHEIAVLSIGLFRTKNETEKEIATFHMGDTIRRESRDVIDALQKEGVNIHILSGDRKDNVEGVAEALNVDHFQGGVSPEEKENYIEALQKKGKRVIFLGDGTNDSLACRAADASFVVKGSSPITFSVADGLLDSRDLRSFVDAKRLSEKIRKRTKLALIWALTYNIIMLIASALGVITPLFAAIAMPLSSLILVLITTSGSRMHTLRHSQKLSVMEAS